MIFQSAILLWALFQILISGSQSTVHGSGHIHTSQSTTHVSTGACSKENTRTDAECQEVKVLCRSGFINSHCRKTCDPLCTPVCPPNWTIFDSKCIKFFGGEMANQENREWSEALAFCKAMYPGEEGVELVQPTNFNELANLIKGTSSNDDIYWVGGSDLSTVNVWRYTNGERIPVATALKDAWAPGQPTPDDNQRCLAQVIQGKTPSGLYDKNCANKYPFICQKNQNE